MMAKAGEGGRLGMEFQQVAKPEQIAGAAEIFDSLGDEHFVNSGSSSIGGFMELLGFSPSLFDSPPSPPPPPPPRPLPPPLLSKSLASFVSSSPEFSGKMDVLPAPGDADQSKSTLTTEADADDYQEEETYITEEEEDEKQKTKKLKHISGGMKKRKEANKGERQEPRFAFMTKSDVENLDDGYRWRKYGQKAVRNGPFPRSYYRCTTALCGVKKRVERLAADPSVVVTTYEGQHTHPRPVGAAAKFSSFSPTPPRMPFSGVSELPFQRSRPIFNEAGGRLSDQIPAFFRDYSLLQDLVYRDAVKKE